MLKKVFLITAFILTASVLSCLAQKDFYHHLSFSEEDSLRGSLRPQRSCYDVTFYHLNLSLDLTHKTLKGYNDIHFKALDDFDELQIDLFYNLFIDGIEFDGESLPFRRKYNAVFIDFPKVKKGENGLFRVHYSGQPKRANDPPWDGGFVWSKDKNKNPWVAVSCEGIGASLWWPNKDHLSDEPDSMAISITVPDSLVCIANGNLRNEEQAEEGKKTFHWFVSYPINNYNVSINIADYVHFSDVYVSSDGQEMACDYYVLPENLEKAEQHFLQVPEVLACFEQYFGKFPFWNDGFALVETPYLGMEHQSAIAYGNQYKRGYLGTMIPRDMDWDYIIVHETGHEYWGNSVSCNDLAEMWIHESFTTYMEALFVECQMGYEHAVRYLNFQRPFILNKEPIIGPMGVNWEDWKGSDHYYKGAWILHTLRHCLDDDDKWFKLLQSLYTEFALSHTTTEELVGFINAFTGEDYTAFFEQYLYFANIPVLEYRLREKRDELTISYRWRADVEGFSMPVWVWKKGQKEVLKASQEWQEVSWKDVHWKEVEFATELFYIQTLELD
jgi:aminopeptidase N